MRHTRHLLATVARSGRDKRLYGDALSSARAERIRADRRFRDPPGPRSAIWRRHRPQGQRIQARLSQGGDGSQGRAERPADHDGRHRLRRGEHLRRSDSDAHARTRWPRRACATTSFTPRRSARRRAPRCSPAAITTASAWQHHGVRHGLSGLHFDHPQERRHDRQHSGRQRLQHSLVRQAPPGSRVDARPGRALRSMGRAGWDSNISTASSAATRISFTRRCSRTRRPCCRPSATRTTS